MSRFYIPRGMTPGEQRKLLLGNRCAECGEELLVYRNWDKKGPYVACHRHDRNGHDGIAGPGKQQFMPNLDEWRRSMTTEVGPVKTAALEQYYGLPVLSEAQITEVVNTIWGDVPPVEKYKALTLCKTYHLNPLLKQLFIVGYGHFESGKRTGTDYEILIGITANRQMALAKSGPYEYLQHTPRAATEAEQLEYNGEVDKERLVSITFLRSSSGKIVHGIGWYPKNKHPKGEDLGNSQRNMANIHSERAALEKLLPPDENLKGVGVVDEKYEPAVNVAPGVSVAQPKAAQDKPAAAVSPQETIRPEGTVVTQGNTQQKATGNDHVGGTEEFSIPGVQEAVATRKTEVPVDLFAEEEKPPDKPPEPEEQKNADLLMWTKEQMPKLDKWNDERVRAFICERYKFDAKAIDTLAKAIGQLDVTQAADFATGVRRQLKNAGKTE